MDILIITLVLLVGLTLALGALDDWIRRNVHDRFDR